MRRRCHAWLAIGLALVCCGSGPRGPCQPEPPAGSLGSICGFRNPEDLAWVPAAGLLLASQMRHDGDLEGGALAALTLGPAGEPTSPVRRLWPPEGPAGASERDPVFSAGDPACTSPPEAARFSPHGIHVGAPRPDGGIPVAVVGHGDREAIERFELRGAGETATLRWTGCVPLPEGAVGNDVWLDEKNQLWVTNYQPTMQGLRGLYHTIAGGLGVATGEALRWSASGWESVPGTRGANPNGILLMPGSAMLAVAFTGSGDVSFHPLEPGGGSAREVDLGGYPDNLTLGPRGTLLVPVHTSGLAFLRCRFGSPPCAAPWKLMEIDPATGAASERFAHDGSVVGGVASVAVVGNRLYFGAVFDDRIGVLIH